MKEEKTKEQEMLENWNKFIQEMNRITKETGYGVKVYGNIYYNEPSQIKLVQYTDDETSGDLDYELVLN